MASLKTLLNEYGKRVSAGAYPSSGGVISYPIGTAQDYETTFTAPADGWVLCWANFGQVDVANETRGFKSTVVNSDINNTRQIVAVYVPCKKGDRIWAHIIRTAGGANDYGLAFHPNSAGG